LHPIVIVLRRIEQPGINGCVAFFVPRGSRRSPLGFVWKGKPIGDGSYPGPDASIRLQALKSKHFIARRYRNRRIGEFLKELDLTEGRGTGIGKIHAAMKANGSRPPRFETDEGRTYFLVELLVHPSFAEQPVEAPVEAPVELSETERAILKFCKDKPRSKREILVGLGYQSMTGHTKLALQRLADLGLLEFTIPQTPNSRLQRRRITPKGLAILHRQS
jgi:ATP-dependent DNA helicase RecG